MKRVNIKLWDILGCFHYILNAPRTPAKKKKQDNLGALLIDQDKKIS